MVSFLPIIAIISLHHWEGPPPAPSRHGRGFIRLPSGSPPRSGEGLGEGLSAFAQSATAATGAVAARCGNLKNSRAFSE
jgi:hypothetical protein